MQELHQALADLHINWGHHIPAALPICLSHHRTCDMLYMYAGICVYSIYLDGCVYSVDMIHFHMLIKTLEDSALYHSCVLVLPGVYPAVRF